MLSILIQNHNVNDPIIFVEIYSNCFYLSKNSSTFSNLVKKKHYSYWGCYILIFKSSCWFPETWWHKRHLHVRWYLSPIYVRTIPNLDVMKGDNPIVDYVPYDMWLDHETIQCAECFAMFLLIRDMAGLLRGAFRTLVFPPESSPLSLTCNITVGLGHAIMIYTVWYVLMHRHVWFKIFQVTSSQSSGTYIRQTIIRSKNGLSLRFQALSETMLAYC